MLGYYPDSLLMNGKSSAQNAGVVGEPEEGKETARVWVQDDWVPTRLCFCPGNAQSLPPGSGPVCRTSRSGCPPTAGVEGLCDARGSCPSQLRWDPHGLRLWYAPEPCSDRGGPGLHVAGLRPEARRPWPALLARERQGSCALHCCACSAIFSCCPSPVICWRVLCTVYH